MVRPVQAGSVGHYRIWLWYEDGREGEVDTFYLAGKGVFAASDEKGVFAKVSLDQHGAIDWPGGIELCPDTLYIRLTGKQPEELFAGTDQPSAIVDGARCASPVTPPIVPGAAANQDADGVW